MRVCEFKPSNLHTEEETRARHRELETHARKRRTAFRELVAVIGKHAVLCAIPHRPAAMQTASIKAEARCLRPCERGKPGADAPLPRSEGTRDTRSWIRVVPLLYGCVLDKWLVSVNVGLKWVEGGE
jgi:hypothetical protein